MVGLGESCTHIAALLFAVDATMRMKETKTVTQKKAYWIVPSVKDIPYSRIRDIDFTSAISRKKKLDAEINLPDVTPIPPLNRPHNIVPEPSLEELNDLYTKASNSGYKPALLSLITPHSDKYVPLSFSTNSHWSSQSS